MNTLQEIFTSSSAIENIKSILLREYTHSSDPEGDSFEDLFSILLSQLENKGVKVPDRDNALHENKRRSERMLVLENRLSHLVFEIFGFNERVVEAINSSSKKCPAPGILNIKSLAVLYLTHAIGSVLESNDFIVTYTGSDAPASRKVFEALLLKSG